MFPKPLSATTLIALTIVAIYLLCGQLGGVQATSINIYKHRYPFYGGYGHGGYPFYGGFHGGYGGIGIGGFGNYGR